MAVLIPSNHHDSLITRRSIFIGATASLICTPAIDVIQEVSDDKTSAKEVRKAKQIKTASKKSKHAKFIKLADKTSNLRAITYSPAPTWSVKRRLDYIDWAKQVVAGLRGASPWLEQQFDHATMEAERTINVRVVKT